MVGFGFVFLFSWGPYQSQTGSGNLGGTWKFIHGNDPQKNPDNPETRRIFYLPDFTQLLIGLEFQGQNVSRAYVNFMKRSLAKQK